MTTPKIYIADLAAYNSGYLHGIWIDATLEPSKIRESINILLASSPINESEEYAIHDFEGFGNYQISEYQSIEEVHAAACFIVYNERLGSVLLERTQGDIEEASKMLDNYQGCYTSIEDFAYEQSEDALSIPEHLKSYIDYERIGRDMEISGEIDTIQTAYNEIHVFLTL